MRQSTMYTCEPIPGTQSPFYAGDRYYANASDAAKARAQSTAKKCAYCGNYEARFGVFCSRECAMAELQS